MPSIMVCTAMVCTSVPTAQRTRTNPRMMPRTLLTTLLAAFLTVPALGQSGGSGIDASILSATGALNAAQKTSVSSYAARSVEAIKSGTDQKAIDDARTALVKPSRDPGATPAFRKAYGVILVTELAPIAKGSDLRRAVVAMQVLRFTRSSDALDVIVECATPSTESDPGKRIAAGSLLIDAFEDLEASNTYYDQSARKLRDAAVAEPDWMALQQKLNALAAAARKKDLPAENARNLRKAQAEALGEIARKSKGSTAVDDRMRAVQRVLVGLRNDLLVMPQADRSQLAKTLAPALTEMLNAAGAQWDAAHASKDATAAYGSVVNSCEVILRLIDRSERPSAYSGTKPDGDSRVLAAAWESGDRSKFDAEAKRWAGIVSAAPYRN